MSGRVGRPFKIFWWLIRLSLSVNKLGYIAGVQLGIKLMSNLAINPYFMMSSGLGDDQCAEYDYIAITSGDQTGLSDPDCGDVASGSPKLEYSLAFQTVGVNLLFPNWGLGINLFAELEEIQGIEGTEVEMYYLTLTIN